MGVYLGHPVSDDALRCYDQSEVNKAFLIAKAHGVDVHLGLARAHVHQQGVAVPLGACCKRLVLVEVGLRLENKLGHKDFSCICLHPPVYLPLTVKSTAD